MSNKIYSLMKKKVDREGLTESNKDMLDVFLLGGRVTENEYKDLMCIKEGEEDGQEVLESSDDESN